LSHFWRILQWKMLVYFTDIWCILQTFGIFDGHLVYLMDIWYILQTFGLFYRHLVYFTDIWSILQTFGIFWGNLVYFVVIWYIFPFLVYCTKKKILQLCCRLKIRGKNCLRQPYLKLLF
jgi:hypothetical protein